MKLFQSEIQDPENYAIFYLDVFAESLVDRKPWLNADPDWADPIAVFKVARTANACYLCSHSANMWRQRGESFLMNSFISDLFKSLHQTCCTSSSNLLKCHPHLISGLLNSLLTMFWIPLAFECWVTTIQSLFFPFAVLKCVFTASWKTSSEHQHSFYSGFFHSIWKWQHVSQCLSFYSKMASWFLQD